MEKDLRLILKKIQPISSFVSKHKIVLSLILVASIYNLMLFKINSLASKEPDPVTLEDKLQNVKVIKIDEDVVKKLNVLEDRNITLETLFDNGRDNPFQE